ncbi:hypothetical protein NDU88_001851 [Pleurodeles waltl]|uniref:Uncharacterized protein n=1 Tax=Pleurodeles waltl TaxID=8319 RepID=A0AAV7KZN9_PLEWA|nr:hypothetical protein NDU88_001851 [Pleurodeles waltl]
MERSTHPSAAEVVGEDEALEDPAATHRQVAKTGDRLDMCGTIIGRDSTKKVTSQAACWFGWYDRMRPPPVIFPLVRVDGQVVVGRSAINHVLRDYLAEVYKQPIGERSQDTVEFLRDIDTPTYPQQIKRT